MQRKFNFSLGLFIGLAVVAGLYFQSLLAVAVVVLISATFYGAMAFCLPCQFYLWSVLKTSKHNILLTFDDGPDPKYTPSILATLKRHNAKAIFFVIGKNAESFPELVQQIQNEGHLLGSHTYNHRHTFGFLPTKGVIAEIAKGQQILGPENLRLFRPPAGITNPNVAKALLELRTTSIGWSLRSLDTVIKNEQKLKKHILRKIKGGDIVLLHDTQQTTASILDELLITLKEQNFTLNNNFYK